MASLAADVSRGRGNGGQEAWRYDETWSWWTNPRRNEVANLHGAGKCLLRGMGRICGVTQGKVGGGSTITLPEWGLLGREVHPGGKSWGVLEGRGITHLSLVTTGETYTIGDV